MAMRGWAPQVAAAIGAAAAAGAAQLGLAYGTGVVSWPTEAGASAEPAWLTSLAWGAWIAATSTVAGAVTAAGLHADRPAAGDRWTQLLWRSVLAVAAAVGALVTVALIAVRARETVAAVASSPQSVAAGYAVLGVCLGVLVAVGALAGRAVAANLIATGAWLWLLAVAVVVESVLSGRDAAPAPLGFAEFDLGELWFRSILLPDAGIALAAALLIGALAALPAARRGDPPVGVALSGATGPLLVAVTYLLAQPDLATAGAIDLSRQLAVPYLVLAGLLGSLLVSAVPSRAEQPEPRGGGQPAGPGAAATAPVPAARRPAAD